MARVLHKKATASYRCDRCDDVEDVQEPPVEEAYELRALQGWKVMTVGDGETALRFDLCPACAVGFHAWWCLTEEGRGV